MLPAGMSQVFCDGYLLNGIGCPEQLRAFQQLHFDSSDVIIISYNPSGAAKMPLIQACQELVTTDGPPPQLSPGLGHLEFHRWHQDPTGSQLLGYPDHTYPDLVSPKVLGIHLPAPLLPPSIVESKARLVYLQRDPKENVVGLHSFLRAKPPEQGAPSLDSVIETFIEGNVADPTECTHLVGAGYLAHMDGYRQIGAHFFDYENFQTQPEAEIARLGAFLGQAVSQDRLATICNATKVSNLKALASSKGKGEGKGGKGGPSMLDSMYGDISVLTPEQVIRIETAFANC